MTCLAILIAIAALPEGAAPAALELPHFPTPLHGYVWRNWDVVPLERIASAIDASPQDVANLGASMGLVEAPVIPVDQLQRSYITVIRRNWHLLPYPQLLKLLGWSEERLAYTLREDDFLYVKLGLLKPKCPPLAYAPPTAEQSARAAEIAAVAGSMRGMVPDGEYEPLFSFVHELSAPMTAEPASTPASGFSPRICHSYFALYGDTLLNPDPAPYPDGYLQRLAKLGVDGVWLQGVLYTLAPFPWDPKLSEGRETRLENLRALVARAKSYGIGVWMYLNEPRAMPQEFFAGREALKGVSEGDHATICTSNPEVRAYIVDSVAAICAAVPDLAGFFTITASENLTSCWSHYQGAQCPRCKERGPAAVIADVNAAIQEGIDRAGAKSRLIAWDWGWQDAWAKEAIVKLPKSVAQMSVSEWDLPIARGGVETRVGEYSLSAIGPGPRATAHWAAAREAGLTPMAKLQLGTTWELGSVPYVPAVANVAEHVNRLRGAGVQGAMLGWTLGGYPSPNVEVATAMMSDVSLTPDAAMERVAAGRFGEAFAGPVVQAWKAMSKAFQEFPYHGGTVYSAPLHQGPSNLLWPTPTKYAASMVGIPYDDVNAWRSVYPADVFAAQLDTVSEGFEAAIATLRGDGTKPLPAALSRELGVAEACAIHYRAVATQTRFVQARDALLAAKTLEEAAPLLEQCEALIQRQSDLATRLYGIQQRDARIGFEATNHYFYVPADLMESVVNCDWMLRHWLPTQRARF